MSAGERRIAATIPGDIEALANRATVPARCTNTPDRLSVTLLELVLETTTRTSANSLK